MKVKNRVVSIAFLSALLIIAKEALSFVPNVEVVTILLIVYTYTLGFSTTIYITFIFTTVQAIMYPPHMWIITYYVIWPLLVCGAHLLSKTKANTSVLAIYAAIFGLSFGAVDSLIQSFVYGFHTFIPIWIRGLPWDLIHGISNYITVLILFDPVYKTMNKLLK